MKGKSMRFKQGLKSLERITRNNSPTILAAIGVSGTITTAYLASKASFKAARHLDAEDPEMPLREQIETVWVYYIPTALSVAATIGCVVGSARLGNRKAVVAAAAYSISEQAFSEYRDKVIETFGENKEQKVRDSLAEDRVRATAAGAPILVSSGGDVLCCELLTNRYFKCDMETLRKAQNDINARLMAHSYATLDDFYYILGIPENMLGADTGWDSDRLMELKFSTTLEPGGKPCLAFEYNYTKILWHTRS